MGVFDEVVKDSLNKVGRVSGAFRDRGVVGGVAQLGFESLGEFNRAGQNIGRSTIPAVNATARTLVGRNAPQIGGNRQVTAIPSSISQIQPVSGVDQTSQTSQIEPDVPKTRQQLNPLLPGTVVGLRGHKATTAQIPGLSVPQQNAQAYPGAQTAIDPQTGQRQVNFGEGNVVGGLNEQQAGRIQASLQQGRLPSTFNTDNFISAQQSQLKTDIYAMAKRGEITPQDALNRINQVEARQQQEVQLQAQGDFQQNLATLAQAGDTRGLLSARAAAGDKAALAALGKFEEKNGKFVPAFDDAALEKKLAGTVLGTPQQLARLKNLVPKQAFFEARRAISNAGRDEAGVKAIDETLRQLMEDTGIEDQNLFRALLDLPLIEAAQV